MWQRRLFSPSDWRQGRLPSRGPGVQRKLPDLPIKGPSSDVGQDGSINLMEQRQPQICWGETIYGACPRGKQHLKALAKPKSHQENVFVCHKEDFHLREGDDVQVRLGKSVIFQGRKEKEPE